MLRLNWFFLCVVIALCSSSCRQQSSTEIRNGTYSLKSAFLNQNGRFRELTCSGSLKIALAREKIIMKMQLNGAAKCAADHPASFVEQFGGDCQLPAVTLTETTDEHSYANLGSRMTCSLETAAQSQILLQSAGESGVRLLRTNKEIDAIQSEIIFERISDEL